MDVIDLALCPQSSPAVAKDSISHSRIGPALRLALLCEIDQSALPYALHTDLFICARKGHPAAAALLDWRDDRLFDAIAKLEGFNGAD